MKISRYWFVFAACALGWLILSLLMVPSVSGLDVMVFRDAGWNLASFGSFESAGLEYMHDLTPRLYAHYTPLQPLLFSGYASIFPRNAYAGTIFNLLLGFSAAALALFLVLRSKYDGRIRTIAALAIAVFPVAFISPDRPEPLGFILACAAIAYTARPGSRPITAGLLIGLVFLAHPFGAIVTSVWIAALFLLRNWEERRRWTLTLSQTGIAGIFTALPLAALAALYYFLDPSSLGRFAAHALGFNSGMGVVLHSKTGLLHSVLKISAVDALRTHGPSILFRLDAVTSLVVFLMLAAWALFNWRRLGHAEWIPLSAGLCCFLLSLILFPTQYNYMDLLAFLVPCSLLIASRTSSKLAFPGIALLLFSVFSVNLFVFSFNLLARFEQRASYQAASRQPAYLLSQLSSPDAVVGFSGDYDLFKPYFHHLIDIQPLGDGGTKVDTSSMAAVANCYSSFVGGPGEVRPLQGKLSSSEFHLIQPAPEHMWITLFGHRITNTQRSLSCDLYLRNSPATGAKAPRH